VRWQSGGRAVALGRHTDAGSLLAKRYIIDAADTIKSLSRK
jgi:hypothetical protein